MVDFANLRAFYLNACRTYPSDKNSHEIQSTPNVERKKNKLILFSYCIHYFRSSFSCERVDSIFRHNLHRLPRSSFQPSQTLTQFLGQLLRWHRLKFLPRPFLKAQFTSHFKSILTGYLLHSVHNI